MRFFADLRWAIALPVEIVIFQDRNDITEEINFLQVKFLCIFDFLVILNLNLAHIFHISFDLRTFRRKILNAVHLRCCLIKLCSSHQVVISSRLVNLDFRFNLLVSVSVHLILFAFWLIN
jgi:hypothetical protein